jgi:RimJ/RimL family protein N-acetyltransferase
MTMRFELSDGVVGVRRYQIGDAADVFAAASESIGDINPWMEWAHPGYALREAEEWVAHAAGSWGGGSEYPMVVAEADTGRLLGPSGLNKIDTQHGAANLGYWIRSSEAGRGLATRAGASPTRRGPPSKV